MSPESSPEHARSIPSLDGLRAVAVTAVILSHADALAYSQRTGILRTALLAIGQGGLGVNAFFIISGFLISTLLLKEDDRDGQISLKRFFLRRSLRICPPYYVFLIVASIVAAFASRPIPTAALVSAATYTSDYYPYAWVRPFLPSWYTLHTWSLGVEEQFYLLWPFALRYLSRRQGIALCVAAVVLTPFLRWLTLFFPVYGMAQQWTRVFHSNADSLAMGCLLAFVFRSASARTKLERCFHPLLSLVTVAYLVACAHFYTHGPKWITALFTMTAANICLAYLIAYAVRRPASLFGSVLNWRPIRHIGLISYSLYLWQQLFLGPYAFFGWIWNLVAVFACAEVSFWVVERPSLRLRGWLEARLLRRGEFPGASAVQEPG